MNKTSKYHTEELNSKSILITGGAGFIGSNLASYLLKNTSAKVKVLDNFSNGHFENIKDFIDHPNFELIVGDIRNQDICKSSISDVDFVSHQAALGSVPRSINNPLTTNDVNINGFLNMLWAVKESTSVRRFVYAASSSTYGDSQLMPKVEGSEGKPLSPYAVTKVVNELYAQVFSSTYNLPSIGLRYFNVFGPKQNPNNAYAAVIPIFCKKTITGDTITIFGDGKTSRDFTFVENVIQANIKSFESSKILSHEVINVACGESISLNDVVKLLSIISGKKINVNYDNERKGDIKHSLASIEKAKLLIGYQPQFKFNEGLLETYNWYLQRNYN